MFITELFPNCHRFKHATLYNASLLQLYMIQSFSVCGFCRPKILSKPTKIWLECIFDAVNYIYSANSIKLCYGFFISLISDKQSEGDQQQQAKKKNDFYFAKIPTWQWAKIGNYTKSNKQKKKKTIFVRSWTKLYLTPRYEFN